MSALPPKADMCSALAHVCFGRLHPSLFLLALSVGMLRSTANKAARGWETTGRGKERMTPSFLKPIRQFVKLDLGSIHSTWPCRAMHAR